MATARAGPAASGLGLTTPRPGFVMVLGLVTAVALAASSYVVHRDDPVQVEALIIVERGANESATARSRSLVETVRPRLDTIVTDAAERAAVTRLVNEPTISVTVEAADVATAEAELDRIVDEILELGRIDWALDLTARRRDVASTLDALLAADDPAPRQQANLEGELAQIDEDLAAGGNLVDVVGTTTTRPSQRPLLDAFVIAVVAIGAAAGAELVIGGARRNPG